MLLTRKCVTQPRKLSVRMILRPLSICAICVQDSVCSLSFWIEFYVVDFCRCGSSRCYRVLHFRTGSLLWLVPQYDHLVLQSHKLYWFKDFCTLDQSPTPRSSLLRPTYLGASDLSFTHLVQDSSCYFYTLTFVSNVFYKLLLKILKTHQRIATTMQSTIILH